MLEIMYIAEHEQTADLLNKVSTWEIPSIRGPDIDNSRVLITQTRTKRTRNL